MLHRHTSTIIFSPFSNIDIALVTLANYATTPFPHPTVGVSSTATVPYSTFIYNQRPQLSHTRHVYRRYLDNPIFLLFQHSHSLCDTCKLLDPSLCTRCNERFFHIRRCLLDISLQSKIAYVAHYEYPRHIPRHSHLLPFPTFT